MTIGRFAVSEYCRSDLSCPKPPCPTVSRCSSGCRPAIRTFADSRIAPNSQPHFASSRSLSFLNNHPELYIRAFGRFHGGNRTDALEFDDPPLLRRLNRPAFRCVLLQRKRRKAFIYNSTSTAAAPLIQTMIPSHSSMTQRQLATDKKKTIQSSGTTIQEGQDPKKTSTPSLQWHISNYRDRLMG